METLRPLGLGELIDRSVAFWRAHWRVLFRLVLAFQLVEFIVLKVAQLAGRRLFPVMNGSAASLRALREQPLEALPQLVGFLALLVGATLLALLLSQVAGVATTAFALPRLTAASPDGPTLRAALRVARARLGTIAGAFALVLLWTGAVAAAVVTPAVLLGGAGAYAFVRGARGPGMALVVLAALALAAAVVGLVLWFLVRFILTSQVIAAEPGDAWHVFRRTAALSSGRVEPGPLGLVKVRLSVLITIIGGLILLMSLVASAPTLLVGLASGVTFQPGQGLDDRVPQALLVPLELLQAAGGALLAPLYAVFQSTFYLDMLVRREGLDLELKLGGAPR